MFIGSLTRRNTLNTKICTTREESVGYLRMLLEIEVKMIMLLHWICFSMKFEKKTYFMGYMLLLKTIKRLF